MITCFNHEEPGQYPVMLEQHGGQQIFRVTYGTQVRDGLTYLSAAAELGSCLMHQAACAGKLKAREGTSYVR